MKNLLRFQVFFLLLLFFSCKPKNAGKDLFVPGFSSLNTDLKNVRPDTAKNEIFYGVLTPVEICSIFNRLALSYNSTALNPVSNKDFYISSSKAALNEGIYGVDFGYLKMFGLGQEMIFYMEAISDISNKLGIPDNLFSEPMKLIQNDMAEPDTIMVLMNKSYRNIEDHLRRNGRESTAALIVIGGYVEALYIATQLIYDPENPDTEVVQKIAEQKYTLASLLTYIKNYYDDPVVGYYAKKLGYLKKYFDSFDIYFKKGDLEIISSRQILRSSDISMIVSIETMNKIREYTAKIRTEIVIL